MPAPGRHRRASRAAGALVEVDGGVTLTVGVVAVAGTERDDRAAWIELVAGLLGGLELRGVGVDARPCVEL
jgi:hypothetical protein